MERTFRRISDEYKILHITILLAICSAVVRSESCGTSNLIRSKSGRFLQCENAYKVNALYILDSNLELLGDADFSNFGKVETFHILNCTFPKTYRGLFAGMKSLKKVTISSSIVPAVVGVMFGEHTSVHSLSIRNNQFRILKGNMSLHFPEVTSIDLSRNKIEEIHFANSSQNSMDAGRGVFSHLQNVTVISLQGNEIKHLRNHTFTDLPRISELDLSFNRIRKIEPASIAIGLEANVNVTVNISSNDLREVRRSMFYLCSGVTKLNLMHNRISRLESGAFSGLGGLKQLFLKNNTITSILRSVFDSLRSLEMLDMSDNLLKTIPANVFLGCKSVPRIVLSGNRIETLHPLSFEGLNSLVELFLDANELSDLNAAFSTLIPNLNYLNLKRNKIARVPEGSFGGCVALETLDLSENRISRIANGAFSANARLRQLHLQHNSIGALHCASFSNLSSLEALDLNGNAPSPFRRAYFSPLRSLKTLTVQLHNGGECECWVLVNMQRQGVEVQVEPNSLNESCKSYDAYIFKIGHLGEKCYLEISEQCEWENSGEETTGFRNLSVATTCEGCESVIEQQETTTPHISHPSEGRVDLSVSLASPTAARGPLPPQEEVQQGESSAWGSASPTPANDWPSADTTAMGAGAGAAAGATPLPAAGRLRAWQVALSLGGGVAAGVLCAGALCAATRVRRRCSKSTAQAQAHVYEEIGEAPPGPLQLLALAQLPPSAPELPPRPSTPPAGPHKEDEQPLNQADDSQLSSRAYLYTERPILRF